MKKLITLVLSLAMVLSMAACGSDAAQGGGGSGGGGDEGDKQLRVAAIFGGAINDGNWNETQYNGLKSIGEAGAEIKYMENVSDTDAAEAARTYASEGFDLVYLTTNSYQDYCAPVAADFPDVQFVQINGTLITDNFLSVRIADEEQGFMQGVIAAMLSQSGKVGFVGGQEINPIKLGSSGFQQGVDYANANYGLSVEAQRINTGSFTDVNQAKETAISLIESGCDVVAPMANDASAGIMEAAEEKGSMAVGCGLGQESSAPTATRINVIKDVAIAYTVTFDLFTKGELKPTETVETYGANKGVVYLTDWMGEGVDDGAKANIQDAMDKLAKGEITISLET